MVGNEGQFKPAGQEPRRGRGGKRPGAGRPTKAEQQAKEQMWRAAFDRLQLNVGRAVKKLVVLMNSRTESISLRAAMALIEFSQKAVERETIEARLEALENKLRQQGKL